MNKIQSSIAEKCRGNCFALAMMVFVMLTSCPVKSTIKNLLGIPVNTEQATANAKQGLQNSNIERCSDAQLKEATLVYTDASHASSLIPVIFLSVIFLFLSPIPRQEEQTHPLYGNLKIPASLPIFLQYRSLII
ncbi:MAG: hypothetical protein ACTJFN_10410 [Sphingobacterium sp.]